MYAGTTLTPLSGKLLGAHQKIDRVARRLLHDRDIDDTIFPTTKQILNFEGYSGPDSIKRKSPSVDEPWHFYSPFNDEDSVLISAIENHYKELVKVLKEGNRERASFEAAWLAHAIVDGLTPAHHYPYEEKLAELRGEGMESRDSVKEKIVISGDTRRETVKNNWKMWGPKGLISTHGLFEMGVASLSKPLSFNGAAITDAEILKIHEIGVGEFFKNRAREIAVKDLYSIYYKKGWTLKRMVEIRNVLMPTIINTVTLAWYDALIDAGLVKLPSKTKK